MNYNLRFTIYERSGRPRRRRPMGVRSRMRVGGAVSASLLPGFSRVPGRGWINETVSTISDVKTQTVKTVLSRLVTRVARLKPGVNRCRRK